MKKSIVGAALAAMLLSLSACGGVSEADAAKAISEDMQKNGKQFKVDKTEADCVAKGLVDELGVEKLQKYKLITTKGQAGSIDQVKMSEPDAKATAGVFGGCLDLPKMVMDQMNMPLEGEQKACLEKSFTEPMIEDMFTQVFQGKTPDSAALTEELTKCMMG